MSKAIEQKKKKKPGLMSNCFCQEKGSSINFSMNVQGNVVLIRLQMFLQSKGWSKISWSRESMFLCWWDYVGVCSLSSNSLLGVFSDGHCIFVSSESPMIFSCVPHFLFFSAYISYTIQLITSKEKSLPIKWMRDITTHWSYGWHFEIVIRITTYKKLP